MFVVARTVCAVLRRGLLPLGRRALLCLCLPLAMAVGALGGVPVTRTSLSGQFTVTGIPFDPTSAFGHAGAVDYALIEPGSAVVSCERIKTALLRELQIRDQWQGKIYLRLRVRRNDDEAVTVSGQDSPSGWIYVVDLPDLMGRRRFFNVMVQVMLFEIANRGSQRKGVPVEMPKWLEEGLPAHLEAQGGLALIAEPFKGGTADQRLGDSVEALRQRLRERPPLSLDELNWPVAGSGVPADSFRDSSHLMVRELLKLERGAAHLSEMLFTLHRTLNWQTSFLAAYGAHFQRMVDVEKWWMLTTSIFLGRERGGILLSDDALSQLSRILEVPLDVSVGDAALPAAAKTTLQKVIADGMDLRVDAVLQRRLPRLRNLQFRCPPPVATLVAGYHDALSSYLTQRSSSGATSPEKLRLLPNARLAVKKVIRQLDELDRNRERMDAELAALVQSRSPISSKSARAGNPPQK